MAEDTSTGSGTPTAGGTTDAAKPATDSTAAPAATTTSTDAAKPVDAKPDATTDAAKAAAPVVPEKYELKLPDGSKADPALVETTAATARELGLSQDQAQKALEFVADKIAAREAELLAEFKPGGEAWGKQVDAWGAAALADPEIGGTQEKLAENVEQAKKVLGTFGSESMNTFLHETGFGSHPEVVRMLAKLGRAMGEGKFVTGGAAAPAGDNGLAQLYPTMHR